MTVSPLSPPEAPPDEWFAAGLRHLQAGRLVEAEQCARNALALDQGHADALHLMGMVCVVKGQHAPAVEWFAGAIRCNPNVPDYFVNLGMALRRLDRFDDAIRIYDRALVLKPDQADIWFRLGECLKHQARNDEALMSFGNALRIDPNHADAAGHSAMLLLEQRKYDQAIERFDRLIQLKPDLADAFRLRAFCLLQLRRLEEALADSNRALELAPDDADILNNTALVLHGLGRYEESLAHADRAITLNPTFLDALINRAHALLAMLRLDEAIVALNAAIAIDPAYASARWNLALIELLLGRFESGWAWRECGRTGLGFFVERNFTQPQWSGEPIAGKTILLHSDEGLGDTIQYVRYVKLVAQRGARVVLQTEDVIVGLLADVEGIALCLPRTGVELPHFDVHCPLSALPLAFKTRLETIPSDVPYLPAPPEGLRQTWDERLGPHDRLRVGLVWSGSPKHGNDRNRSMPLHAMCGILDAGARFFSLQKDPRPDDRVTLREHPEILDLTEHLADFIETAAMISCLDLVITVDTSVAHLAGALGTPVWILLPYAPDYRWLLDRDDSPWYPTARLFRQSATRDYADVLARVRNELTALVASRFPAG